MNFVQCDLKLASPLLHGQFRFLIIKKALFLYLFNSTPGTSNLKHIGTSFLNSEIKRFRIN